MDSPNTAEALPVRAVTLFSSGVSYTLREGEIDGGETSIALTFRTTQISDILKSLVLLDEAGTVRAATYPSRDPIGRTLQSFAVNVTGNLTRAELLAQVRGAEIRVETAEGEALEGRIVGIEEATEWGTNYLQSKYQTLNLLSEVGLVAVRLDRVRLLRLLDPRLEREFRDALTVLASGSDDNRRQVTLTFSGTQRRPVRVGYISESPVWKVSYRLVLEDKEKPYLQGWAMVENTTEDDWDGVHLSLVSGRPVSFIQDLYQPLYVPRPIVPPDIAASPYPQMHGADMQKNARYDEVETVDSTERLILAPPSPAMTAKLHKREIAQATPLAAARGQAFAYDAIDSMESARDTVVSQASGQSAGELFEYQVSEPVHLPRQQAAMIPIVADDFDGEKLSLYNANTDERFPRNAFRLINPSELHLKGGPITVFDGGVYSGEARMEDIPPGDSRLITYAVDLSVEGELQEGTGTSTRESLSIRRGVLVVSRFHRRKFTYNLKSKAKAAKTVLIEHPFSSDWTLLEPENPSERTQDRYRFAVSLPAGETRSLVLRLERPIEHQVALFNSDTTTFSAYASREGDPPALQQALTEVLRRRREITELSGTIGLREGERQTILEEQGRIRQNLGAVKDGSSLYRRYMEQLERQENRLSELLEELDRLRQEVGKRTAELKSYLDGLKIE